MTGHGAKFGRKKDDAIVALLTHRNVEQAAKSIGLAPKTLLRWMQVPEFDADYRKVRRTHFTKRLRACSRLPGQRSRHCSNSPWTRTRRRRSRLARRTTS
jgi:hypothetical protein